MYLLNKCSMFNYIKLNVRCYCSKIFDYQSIYTAEENEKILSEINARHINDLSKYKITKARLNKLESYKIRIGKFNSIEQLLEIDGFGVKVLENFCNSILREEIKQADAGKPKVPNLLHPYLNEKIRSKINSFISIHINISHISWSRLQVHQEPCGTYSSFLTHWDQHEFKDKKYQLHELINIILYLNKIIPQGDVYLFEDQLISQGSVTGSQPGSLAQVTVNVQKIQIISMLSLILSSRNLGESINTFYLKRFVASRLFGLFVGNEKVSTASVVHKLLKLNNEVEHDISSENNNSQNTNIEIKIRTTLELKEKYSNFTNVQKELQGQSLLLGIAFLKLCIEKCTKSYYKLSIRSK